MSVYWRWCGRGISHRGDNIHIASDELAEAFRTGEREAILLDRKRDSGAVERDDALAFVSVKDVCGFGNAFRCVDDHCAVLVKTQNLVHLFVVPWPGDRRAD